jgi:hypothetical protein
MSNTDTNNTPHSLHDILQRMAPQLLLFSLAFATLLVLSWILLLPRLTQVEIAGAVRGIPELREYSERLEGDIADIQKRRNATLLPLKDSLYGSLVQDKVRSKSLLTIQSELKQIASSLVPDTEDAVVFSSVHFSESDQTLALRGLIQNVGPRSMTVLAQLVETLRDHPTVEAIEGARFVREEDGQGSFYSPFHLTVLLK